jgi:thiosulfate/3-mercaptopyruvate sulfurtransferase
MLAKTFGRKNTLLSAVEATKLIEYCQLNKISLRILATTYTFPVIDKDRFEFFQSKRIENATYLDIDEVADKNCGVPHTAPNVQEFSGFMKDLDVAKDDVLLLYDDYSVLGSSRAWYMMKAFGFKGFSLCFTSFITFYFIIILFF